MAVWEPYYLLAMALQLGLGAFVVLSRLRSHVNWAVGILFLLNGIATAPMVVRTTSLAQFAEAVDHGTGWVILYIALAFPASRLPDRAMALVCGAGAALAMGGEFFARGSTKLPFDTNLGELGLLLGFTAMLLRLPGLLHREGFEHGQAALLFAAIAMRGMELGAAFIVFILSGNPAAARWVPVVAVGLWAMAAMPWKRAAARSVPGALLLLFGFLFGLLTLTGAPPANNFTLYFLRPVVVGYALLRYQVLGVTPRVRTALSATAAILLGSMGFLALKAIVAARWSSLAEGWVPDLAAIGGVAVAGSVAWGVAGRLRSLAPGNNDGWDHDLLVYRAELEQAMGRARSDSLLADPVLRRIRTQAGISDREHAMLVQTIRHGRTPREAGTMLLGRYAVLRPLGRGSHGRTLLCRDLRTQGLVAVKELLPYWSADEGAMRRFRREVAILQSLDHPNIVRLRDSVVIPEQQVLVMDYAEGGSLDQRLGEGPLGIPEAVAVTADVLAGLEAVHLRGILHRDVKPANILLSGGRAKVADFGVSSAPDGTGTLAGLSIPARGVGTLLYMAPEQVRGEQVGPSTDLYAVGAVLYQCLTGHHYLGELASGPAAATAILGTPPALDVDTVPRAFRPFLARALAKEPSDRFQSAAEMRAALLAEARRAGMPASSPL